MQSIFTYYAWMEIFWLICFPKSPFVFIFYVSVHFQSMRIWSNFCFSPSAFFLDKIATLFLFASLCRERGIEALYLSWDLKFVFILILFLLFIYVLYMLFSKLVCIQPYFIWLVCIFFGIIVLPPKTLILPIFPIFLLKRFSICLFIY